MALALSLLPTFAVPLALGLPWSRIPKLGPRPSASIRLDGLSCCTPAEEAGEGRARAPEPD